MTKGHVFFLLLKASIETDLPFNRKSSKELTIKLGFETFNEEDTENKKEMQGTGKSLIEETKYLKEEFETTKSSYSAIKQEIQLLKQILNTTLFKADQLKQYDRRKNLRMHSVPESKKSQEDGEKALLAVAQELNVSIDKQVDIQ